MSINGAKIKKQVQKAIALNPTNITVLKPSTTADGVGGLVDGEPTEVGSIDVYFDDSGASAYAKQISDSGEINRSAGIKIYAVCEGFTIEAENFFFVRGISYRVLYSSVPIEGIFLCDVEVVR